MKDTTFWPGENIDMKERMADMWMLDLAGSGKAIDAPEANIDSDVTDCLGGGGVYGSQEAFMTLLYAVLNMIRDCSRHTYTTSYSNRSWTSAANNDSKITCSQTSRCKNTLV